MDFALSSNYSRETCSKASADLYNDLHSRIKEVVIARSGHGKFIFDSTMFCTINMLSKGSVLLCCFFCCC